MQHKPHFWSIFKLLSTFFNQKSLFRLVLSKNIIIFVKRWKMLDKKGIVGKENSVKRQIVFRPKFLCHCDNISFFPGKKKKEKMNFSPKVFPLEIATFY